VSSAPWLAGNGAENNSLNRFGMVDFPWKVRTKQNPAVMAIYQL